MRGLDPGCSTVPSVGPHRRILPVVAGLTALLLISTRVSAAPDIRMSATNHVPACATPERLTAFLVSRNPNVDPRYRDIARWYKYWGDAWRVRWDYAFFQMIIETNALKFRRGDGQRGDVHEKQNNFAGIGATGGGVPGDRFPDVKTGVHAQIQHLVAYSGERLASPIAPRTEQQQDGIITQSLRLRRPVTYGDLARRWAADRAYSRTIDAVAEQFRSGFCTTVTANAAPSQLPSAVPAPRPATRKRLDPFPPPYRLGGPKPSKLAGPETLPWADPDVMTREYDQSATDNSKQPVVRDAIEKPASAPPVRTIWSRDTSIAATQTPSQQAERPAEASEPGDTPTLPHFKIAPETLLAPLPPPSRLGGPVDVAPKAMAAPTARFKDIVLAPPSQPAAPPRDCKVLAASYGGNKTLLVRAKIDGVTRYTALTVIDGFEKSLFDVYTKSSAPGAEIVGEYESKEAALADAYANCSSR
jgi:hypothetical protein